ncbi:PREDICTED: aluminum-activated malate transporter 8-like [Brassica oleracea var. oleracea]|uniref:Aluminum-activated malate transporter n=1 Tax=Brassica oleracea var. oleracea TaxID=109376 RepID=A0A0D3DAM5_BRAOL|nr:PREDICTED: aluminum-activated malate transporter 8-like [Brassica oleracea var. oleracea]
MEMDLNAQVKKACFLQRLKDFPSKLKDGVTKRIKHVQKFGKDDPRRIIHSIKVGLSLTLVSMLYYVRPLYNSFGVSGMWAILTVVVVSEFTVGGTLSKGLNRAFATLIAGALGVGAVHLARLCGHKGEPIVLGILVFSLGSAVTFSRFFPRIKQRYDYGALIFILTFSMVAVSGYRTDEILVIAYQRLSTILIGGTICILVSIFVFPVWAGEDLHKLVANNIIKLANSLEGFEGEYFPSSEKTSKETNSSVREYKSILTSESTEDTLTNLARWEPGHGRFRLRHPWTKYFKIAGLVRQCAIHFEVLNGCVLSDAKAPPDFISKIQEPCSIMSREAGEALKDIAKSIKTMSRYHVCVNTHIKNSKNAIENLRLALKLSFPETEKDLLEIIPGVTMASTLIYIVNYVEKISEAVEELSVLAHFKETLDPKLSPELGQHHLLHKGTVKPVLEGDNEEECNNSPHVVIANHNEQPPTVNENNVNLGAEKTTVVVV